MLRNINDLEIRSFGATDGDIGQEKDFYFDDFTWASRHLDVDTDRGGVGHRMRVLPRGIAGVVLPDRSLPPIRAAKR